MRQIKDNAQRSGAGLIATEKPQKNPVGAETVAARDDECDIFEKMHWIELVQQMKKQNGGESTVPTVGAYPTAEPS